MAPPCMVGAVGSEAGRCHGGAAHLGVALPRVAQQEGQRELEEHEGGAFCICCVPQAWADLVPFSARLAIRFTESRPKKHNNHCKEKAAQTNINGNTHVEQSGDTHTHTICRIRRMTNVTILLKGLSRRIVIYNKHHSSKKKTPQQIGTHNFNDTHTKHNRTAGNAHHKHGHSKTNTSNPRNAKYANGMVHGADEHSNTNASHSKTRNANSRNNDDDQHHRHSATQIATTRKTKPTTQTKIEAKTETQTKSKTKTIT